MSARRAKLMVVHAAELVTLAGHPGPHAGSAQGALGLVEDGAVAVDEDGLIVAAGPMAVVRDQVQVGPDTRVVDAGGRAVVPGFVDPHTHAVFAGDRVAEFEQRLRGADYLAILGAGGGILQTVRETRAVSEDRLYARASYALDQMLAWGTTAVEVKTGYGLRTEDELKMLRVIGRLAGRGRQTVVGTLLAAHAVPPEYQGRADAYVELVCAETIPAAARLTAARFCDVFCEVGAFSVDQARRVLEAGMRHGLRPKIHAEQKHRLGGAQLAAEVGAISADHLEHAEDDDLTALRDAGTVAVLLPGAAFMLRDPRRAQARRMVELGVPVALGSDFNPGSCPIWSMPLVIGLACVDLGLTPAEAITAATINAAHAIGLGATHGSLEPGKRGDLVVLDAPSHRYIPYFFGAPLVHTVVLGGRVVAEGGQLCA